MISVNKQHIHLDGDVPELMTDIMLLQCALLKYCSTKFPGINMERLILTSVQEGFRIYHTEDWEEKDGRQNSREESSH